MKITKQDFASIVLVVVFLLSFGQAFAEDKSAEATPPVSGWAGLFSSGAAPTHNAAGEPVNIAGYTKAELEAGESFDSDHQAPGPRIPGQLPADLFEPYTGPVVRAPSWPASYPADYHGIGVPGFTPEHITNPFVTLPNGQTYAHNPLEYVTLETANTVAAMLGGVVRQSDWVGGPSTPSYGIYTADGRYIGNAAGLANTIANIDPLTALREITIWGGNVPTDSPLYLAAQAQLRNPNLANTGFTSPSQILGLPASLYGDVRIPSGGSGSGGVIPTAGSTNFGNIPQWASNLLQQNGIQVVNQPLDWKGPFPRSDSRWLTDSKGNLMTELSNLLYILQNNPDPTSFGGALAAMQMTAQAAQNRAQLQPQSQIPHLPVSLYGDVRIPDTSGAGGCCGEQTDFLEIYFR